MGREMLVRVWSGNCSWLLTPFSHGLDTILILGALLAAFLLAFRDTQDAAGWTACAYPDGHCNHAWNQSSLTWTHTTGWTGAKHDAIVASGSQWHVVSQLNVYYDGGAGPYQAAVGLAALGSGQPPGVTVHYADSSGWLTGTYSTLNSSWTWYTDGTMNAPFKLADVRTVTMHEMGHWWALGHDCGSAPAAVMCPDYTKKWSIHADDDAGMSAIYGAYP